ncbi:MAG: putative flap endonuclease-1-like 5' DNA nuclease [Glaciecola sp.]|jgi:predicted flap endonuclease-1-like 5' DNA nuclease
MTKKTEKKSAKKVTVDKTKSAATLKEINNTLTSTKKNLETQVEDLSAQVKKLRKKSGKKASKMLKKLDASYHQRLLHLQTEFEQGLATLSTVQDKVLERLPNIFSVKSNPTKTDAAKSTKPVALKTKAPISQPQPKPPVKNSTIASIKGIGPVMQKKLAEQGITTLADIGNTPKSKIEALKQFEKERGFTTWKEQAKTLLANNEANNS